MIILIGGKLRMLWGSSKNEESNICLFNSNIKVLGIRQLLFQN
jgi:hypothetical protein